MKIKELNRRFLGRLRRDQRGGILVTAALAMLPITMLAFAAVEFHNYTRQRTALQDALDAAALAVARAPTTKTEAELRTVYIAVLRAHLGMPAEGADPGSGPVVLNPAQVSVVNGRVTASATLRIKPIIANFFVNGDLLASGSSVVLRESKGLEVVLVLDDTASMTTNNRIGITKTAATNFVTELERASAGTASPGAIKIGFVPFAGTVNVGAGYRGQAWLDPNAQSPIHNEIFSTAAGAATSQNRWTLLSTMQIQWAGCVESRPMPYDVQETAPTSSTPATLFVPHFYPDEADHIPSTVANASTGTPAFHNRFSNWNALGDPGPGIQPYAPTNQWVRELIPAFADYDWRPPFRRLNSGLWQGWQVPAQGSLSDADDRANVHNTFGRDFGGYFTPQTVAGKYTLAAVDAEVTAGRFNKASLDQGPNMNCKMPPLARLTTNTASIKTAINSMTAASLNTNIPVGMMWGWHLLSPQGPFADGVAYNTPNITKVLIVMTDGENFLNTSTSLNGAHYSAIGYPHQNRIGVRTLSEVGPALNRRLETLCTNVKNAGVVVYTIRVEVTGPNTLLQNCASSADKAYDVTQASQLDGAFRSIARSVQKLRIVS